MSFETLKNNDYPGRGIIVGRSKCGRYAVIAYFIMGRSENSRNRIFVEDKGIIRTEALDPSKLTDPSLIIYNATRNCKYNIIVTNGDQTDTIYDFVQHSKTFEEALNTREYEPDEPNFTPRISAMVTFDKGQFTYKMSILKNPSLKAGGECERLYYDYPFPEKGEGRLIHTYKHNAQPIPSFEGDPIKVDIEGGTKALAKNIWASLNDDNKVSLFVRRIDLKTFKVSTEIINKGRLK